MLQELSPLFEGRVKEDPVQGSVQIQLSVFEYYIFWFAYYPVCKGNSEGPDEVVVRKNRRFRLENWTLPVLASSARGLGQKVECSLYLRLLYAYLRAFVPNYGLNIYQPYRSSLLHYSSGYDGSVQFQAEFLVHTLVHYWLVDNDFSPMPVKFCRSLGVSFPFQSTLREIPPTAGLGEVVKLLVNYLNSNFVENKGGLAHTESSGTPRRQAISGSVVTPFSCGNSVGSWNLLIQRPVYRFILRTFLFCPMSASIKNVSQVFTAWMSYLEPWKISAEDFSKLDALETLPSDSSRHENALSQERSTGCLSDCVYTPSWQGYVISNYLFYTSLVVHFLGFAHKFLHTNTEMIIQMVLQVLGILTSSRELMDLLKNVDAAYRSKLAGSSHATLDAPYKYVPSIREQLQEWEDGLCECDADGSFLHENWNNDLRLFSEGENGGRQLLQLLILRAEHEIRAVSGDLQTLDSLRAQMGCLFGVSAERPPALVIPESMHGQHGRDEVFTPKHPGVGKRTWADVKYKGDWMKRPISDGEVAWLARLLVRLSDWLNETLGLDQGDKNSNAGSPRSYVDVPSDDVEHVGGLKDALLAVLLSIAFWLVLLGQALVGFMRRHGLRINLRLLASKRVVMALVVYAAFLALKRCSQSPILWISHAC